MPRSLVGNAPTVLRSAVLAIACVCAATCWDKASADENASSFAGRWAFSLPDGNPAWLKLEQADSGWTGQLLWSVGSARPIRDVVVNNNQVRFRRKVSWRPGGHSMTKTVVEPFRGEQINGQLRLAFSQKVADQDGAPIESLYIIGERIPPLPPKPDLSRVQFGEPVKLFNGNDLSGWTLSRDDKRNGWSASDGCLVNETPKQDFGAYGDYGNLMTERTFNDFKIRIDYNVPAGGNSGVYLRGMYEAQVVDRDSRMQGIQGPGAIFGRIAPSHNAGKPGGQWNTYELTLVDRHITVTLNGETVIDNEPIEGCTGGGIQANDTLAGPILLQGDHTSVRYRNIVIRPVITEAQASVSPK